MEGLQKAIRAGSHDGKPCMPSFSSSSSSSSGDGGGAAAALTANQSGVLVTRPLRQAVPVSLLTSSKLCAVCFVAGVIVGFTLRQRVRIWASKLLKRIKDD